MSVTSSYSDEYTIRLAKADEKSEIIIFYHLKKDYKVYRDIQKIFRFLENMFEDTKDSFLPFGFHLAIRVGLLYWLLLMIEMVVLICLAIDFYFSPFTPIISVLFLIDNFANLSNTDSC